MNFGMSSESKSEAQDNDQTLGDYGQANQGKGAVTVNPGSVAMLGKSSLNTGITLKGVKGNVILGDGGAAAADLATSLAGSFNTSLQSLASKQAETIQVTDARNSELLGNVLQQVGELSESKATGGQSTLNKSMLWVVGGVLLLLGVLFYGKKK